MRRLKQPISEQDMNFVAERHTSLACLVRQSIMLVHSIPRDLLESLSVTCKVTQVVPAHSIDICLGDFISKLGMMFGQEKVDILISNECSLLNDLRIDTW